MADRAGADIGLGDRLHPDGGLHPDLHALLLQHVGNGQRVDGGGQHAHVVGANPLHLVAAVLQAAPEIAAAYYHAYLHIHLHTALNHIAHLADDLKVQAAGGVSRQGLAADLQKYPFEFGLLHTETTLLSFFLFPILIYFLPFA